MPRFASPALSENEFDISNALFGGQDTSAEQEDDHAFAKSASKPGKDETLDFLDLSEEDDGDAGFIARKQAGANRRAAADKSGKKSTGFQAMGLDPPLMKAIMRKGFSVPTPIQRKAIPLILDRKDVVGMARTGSGKTAAFVIPMIQRLKAHVAKVGARAAIMSPSRELALQTLKVVKEFGKGTDLRTVLLVGGDSLEEQFAAMTSNPDIIIATPGRFLHLKVEMGLDLSSIQYMVFDEADRLFELGFATQLGEILHGLPQSRQTLLFSATLPKSLVEFARAGLEEPKLVRLDAESKISPDLENAFFTVKSAEKEGALLHLIQDVIKIPLKSEASNGGSSTTNPKKRKRPQPTTSTSEAPTEHSTIVFCSTKHHVEYLANLLQSSGYAVSYVYGSLDQVARNSQIDAFRDGTSNILVVTDVAARGIDIPVLANVINYDFPSQAKIFVHRVGRTARAGRKGWSYSLIRDADVPYMLDLQLFLGRRLILGRAENENLSFAEDFVVGALARDKVESCVEWVNKLLEDSPDLDALRDVAGKGEKQWMRSRNSASSESAKRAKTVLADKRIMELNQLFNDDVNKTQMARDDMLARISEFRPHETIFEIGKRGTGNAEADIMRTVRGRLEPKRRKAAEGAQAIDENDKARPRSQVTQDDAEDSDAFGEDQEIADMSDASEDELEVTFSTNNRAKNGGSANTWQDSEHFISYTPRESNMAEERGYGVHSGADSNNARSFIAQAADVSMDLTNDESKGFGEATRAKGMRWDKKGKKYVSRANDEDGSKGTKYVRGESGQKIAASFRAGRFDAWKKAQRITRMPRVGESETRLPNVGMSRGGGGAGGRGGARYRHQSERAPKAADRFRDDYHVQKKRFDEAKEKRIGAFKDGGGRNEVRGVEGVRKERKLKEKRKEKNARPAKRRKT